MAKGNPDKEDVHSPRVPDLDGPVTRGGHDVLLVEVDDIDRGSVTDEHPPEVNFGWRDLSKMKSCHECTIIIRSTPHM